MAIGSKYRLRVWEKPASSGAIADRRPSGRTTAPTVTARTTAPMPVPYTAAINSDEEPSSFSRR